jgi:hypothetical protein
MLQSQNTHIVAMATFWRENHHNQKPILCYRFAITFSAGLNVKK